MRASALLADLLARMARRNVTGVLGGSPELVAAWQRAAPGRFIAALALRFDAATGVAYATTVPGAPPRALSVDTVRALYQRGAFRVLAEVSNLYAGIAPNDPRLEPWFALAEELDIPVGIHVGGGGPAAPYVGFPNFRARLQSPFLLEDVLVRHPKLRLWVMHAGYPMLEEMQALLLAHPQVYVDLGYTANVEPRAGFYRFLRGLMDAGFGDRIMFGSDQMLWPGLLDEAVRSIEQAPFLSAAERRAIFHDNAARFLRLPPEPAPAHRGR
ncbi:MAG: amidohydrolase family protein [Gemmatimonadetes bacterium]|nr:amidohydrolase family protein [Gemmatimonadota bacterium]